MAVFKILCFIGFVLLSCGHARKRNEAKDRLFHPRQLIPRYKYIVQQHRNAFEIPMQKSATRKSEKGEEWEEYNRRPIALHREVNPYQKRSKSFEPTIVVAPDGKGPNYEIISRPGRDYSKKEPTNSIPGIDNLPDKTIERERENNAETNRISVSAEGCRAIWNRGVPGPPGENEEDFQLLPTFEDLVEKVKNEDVETTFKVTDSCQVKAKKTGSLYQLAANPPDCVNLKILLEKVLPKGKTNFESITFMNLEHIIIRSISLDTSTKGVEIVAAYTGTVTLVKDILTLSNVRVELSFVWTQPEKFTFDISATFTIGDVPVNARLIRNEEGYSFSALATGDINAAAISRMFQQEGSFLPSTGMKTQKKRGDFDKFTLVKPRLRATLGDGYGFLFAGSIRILDWDPYDVNVLINKQNDLPATVTIAVYIPKFSIGKMFKDLFEMDVSNVPVLRTVEVRNLALSLSTGDVPAPLEVLDIGSEDIPYCKGVKISFEIPIEDVYVSTSVFITPTLILLTISQNGELNLGHVIKTFAPDNDVIVKKNGHETIKNWPSFVPNPLAIALLNFHVEAKKTEQHNNPGNKRVKTEQKAGGSWALTTMNMKLKLTQPISLFGSKITINDLELDLNYEKGKDSSFYGVLLGQVALGNRKTTSPKVDIRIPFPFKNEEISFTFTDFSVKNVVKALAGSNLFPKDFSKIFAQIQLDKIALNFGSTGKITKITVDASIPGQWHIFGKFSIADVSIHFEYGTTTTSFGDEGLLSDNTKEWKIIVKGKIIIGTCTISIEADFGSDLVSVSADGAKCSVSVGDIVEKFGQNGISLPPMISGFTIFDPQLRFMWQRKAPPGQPASAVGKSIAFAATTNLFQQSQVELALINHGDQSAIVAGFAIDANALSEIDFLKPLGLTDVAVVYVSKRIPIKPYEFLNPIFQKYITSDDPDVPEFKGITIYAKFVPSKDTMLGRLLRQGIRKDSSLRPKKRSDELSLTVKISFPDFIFEVELKLGPKGVEVGRSGFYFTYMKLIVSKSLIGLELKCKIAMDSKKRDKQLSTFTGNVAFTFTGTVTISLLWKGTWNNPFGISKRLTIRRLGLAIGINVATLIPSFGITGAITVRVPSAKRAPPIQIDLTLCIDPTKIDQTVFQLHFTRLLLEDVINLFARKVVKLPRKLGEIGFPDPVQIYFSPAGNPNCFGKSYQAGVEIHGTLQVPFLSIRARIDLSIALPPSSSFRLDASLVLDPIDYLNGLIKIVNANSGRKGAHLRMVITEQISDLLIDGSCRVEIFGAMISVNLQINKEKFFFEGRLNLWNLFQVYISVDIKIGGSSKSVHVVGEMQNDLFAKLKQKASQGIQNGAKAINQEVQGAVNKIRDAERDVDSLLNKISYHKRKIKEANNECSRAPLLKKYICIGTAAKVTKHGLAIGGLKVAHGTAKAVLKAARFFLKGVQALIKVGADVLEKLVNTALSLIDIKYVKFDVLMNGVTKRFKFKARIVILRWTFTPKFEIDFSSSRTANKGIDSASKSISKKTLEKVKR